MEVFAVGRGDDVLERGDAVKESLVEGVVIIYIAEDGFCIAILGGLYIGRGCLGTRTIIGIPVVFILDFGTLLGRVELLVRDFFELDHFGVCVI